MWFAKSLGFAGFPTCCFKFLCVDICRPWYIETAAPFIKNVVVMFDTTVSEDEMEHLRKAVISVLDTLGPHDRVSAPRCFCAGLIFVHTRYVK